jgi:hypothetical protein
MNNDVQFWGDNFSVLLKKDKLDLYPKNDMTYGEKLNSITRLVILLSLLGFIFTFSIKFIFIGLITITIIYILYYSKNKEGFNINSVLGNKRPTNYKIINPDNLEKNLKENFYASNSKNPFGNVLLPEIKYDKNREAAPPSFNPEVYEDITNNTKKMVQELNPGIIDTDKQLFGDLAEEFMLDQSNRVFFSNANTRVTNDQTAYAKFLYGDMPSCKNNDTLECVKDSYRYTLY